MGDSDSDSDDVLDYNSRLQELLLLRDEKKKKTKCDWQSFISSYYGTDDLGVHDLDRFIIDYHKFAQNIDVDQLYITNHGKCSFSTCKALQRTFRNRKKYDLNKKHRLKLYDECSDEKEIVLYQLMDQIHISSHHLIDMGYRYLPNKSNENNNDKNKQLKARKTKLLKKIRNDQEDDTKSKFITKMDRKTIEYQFGVRFYYHDYYQNKHVTEEQVPGASIGCIDYG